LHDKPVLELSDDVMALLGRYRFPGNVRELENIINGAVLIEQGRELTRGSLPPYVLEAAGGPRALAPTSDKRAADLAERPMEEVEREHIERVLRHAAGNRSAASRILGMSRATLIAKIKRYGLAL